MVNYYVERLAQLIITTLAVITLSFALLRLMPGGPMDYLRAQLASEMGSGRSSDEIDAIVESYVSVNPNDPIYIAYFDYVTSILQGDFGQSIWYSRPVSEILAEALPWTVFIMLSALIFTFTIGIALGAAMAYFEGSRFDTSATIVSVILTSIPYYIFALVLLFAFAYQIQIFPTGDLYARGETPGLNISFLRSALHHATLPILSLVLTGFGGWALSMRGNAVRILGEDYLRVAELRGIPDYRISLKYVGQNAVLPMYTGLMISIGFMFGGAVILEEIFKYPGLGYYILRAVEARDYPLLMGGFIVITLAVLVAVLIADLTYGKIDPRAGGGENRETY
ncbi:ABC transporter permease [Halobacteria archaeon AArc-m2/3/4]|uniref:ABC transporter permease n=1 Tax=Natronoglomus mannanivorans TaxID=2979990 RepID=A0AAP2Z3N3_9EURY|nr:ABC transporter permease [Halobacteria archaeon AArc-xg1-1]MCU4975966.1 ABC transporter permease [Halobacteria archaeon AArc-m2/3/4]